MTQLEHLEQGTTTETALTYFDSLPPVTVPQMIGSWRGSEVLTGHPLDGQLTAMGWHGKRFGGPEDVDPLVMDRAGGGTFTLNPSLVPMGLALRHSRLFASSALQGVLRKGLPLMSTRRPAARLRMAEYRGVVSATMVYDRIPVNDHFRMVDAGTLLGAMDQRGAGSPFLFILRREPIL